jgi:hypothetical protein
VGFDIFLQGFAGGDACTAGSAAAERVLTPFVLGEADEAFARLQTDDGGAEVYGLGSDSLLVSRPTGQRVFGLLVEAASVAGWAIMPVGCATCVTDDAVIKELPDELRDDVVLVRSGDDLMDVIERV